MSFGFGFGLPRVSGGAFSPLAIFASGAQGVQFDATDYNSQVFAWRRNLLTYTQDFSNAAWTKSNASLQSNLLTYSQDLKNAVWGAKAFVTENAAVAPDGTTTADRIVPTVADNVVQTVTVVPTLAYTFSFYAKNNAGNAASYRVYDITHTADIVATTSFFSSINDSTWSRITVTFTAPAGCISAAVYVMAGNVTGADYFVWGAQLELGSTANTYRATGSASLPILFTAPDGTLTAMKLVESTANGRHWVDRSPTISSGEINTVSFYLKAAERGYGSVCIGTSTGPVASITFSLATGAVTSTNGTAVASSVASIGDGWYRGQVALAQTSTGLYYVQCGISNSATPSYSAGLATYVGDGTSGIYIWGAQLEKAAAATAYQPLTDVSTEFLAAFPNYSMYQDNLGATAAWAVEQTVGLVLDKHLGGARGAELLANPGGPYTATTGYAIQGTGVLGLSAGRLVVTQAAANTDGVLYALPSGTWGTPSILTFTIDIGSQTQIQIQHGNGTYGNSAINNKTITASGTYSVVIYFGGVAGSAGLTIKGLQVGTFYISGVSLRYFSGNHATQATAINRPILRSRYNLLTYSEQFDNVIWARVGSTVTANAAVAPDGTTTADQITFPAGSPFNIYQTIPSSVGANTTVTFSVYLRAAAPAAVYIGFYEATGGIQDNVIANVTTTWQKFSYTRSVVMGSGDRRVWLISNTTLTDVFAWGADLRYGSAAGTYQRIAAATDYDSDPSKFLPYFAMDGSNDAWATAAIDFSATDKMSVFAGVTKLSDAATGMITELSAVAATNLGTFYLAGPWTAGSGSYRYLSCGTSAVNVPVDAGYPAPVTSVLAAQSSISAPSALLRVNGVQEAISVASQGTGNFGAAYPLYIGARAGATQPFNGRIYSLTVVGKLCSASEIASMETWAGARAGLTLPGTFTYLTDDAGAQITDDAGSLIYTDYTVATV
jgi:hypothetical protein